MPDLVDLFSLQKQAAKAENEADAAEKLAQSAASDVAEAQKVSDAEIQQATVARQNLERIQQAVAAIPAAQAELQQTEQTLVEIDARLSQLDQAIAALEVEIERRRNTFPFIVPLEMLNQLEQLRVQRELSLQLHQEDADAVDRARNQLKNFQDLANQLEFARKADEDAAKKAADKQAEVSRVEMIYQNLLSKAKGLRSKANALLDQYQLSLNQLIPGLSTYIPIAFLPIRLETRFPRKAPDLAPNELLIRVYPEGIHLDKHEPGLSPDEQRWGKHFWQETWRAGLAAADSALTKRRSQELAAWQQLAERFGPPRAAYIAHTLTPRNPNERPPQPTQSGAPLSVEPDFKPNLPTRSDSWTRAELARALPDRWIAVGFNYASDGHSLVAGTPFFSQLIPAELHTGLAPSLQTSSTNISPGVIPIDPGISWMVDFKEAEIQGMGIRMQLTADQANGFDRLVVFGVKAAMSNPVDGAQDGAVELADLFSAHRFTWGCEFVPQGTPTNNTESVDAGYSRDDPGFQSSFALEWDGVGFKPGELPDGILAAQAFGIPRTVFERLRFAGGHEQLDATNFNRVLWPATLGYFIDQILNDTLPAQDSETWREYFVSNVRARGPLPALRIGHQPYGVLPVTSLDRWVSGRMDLVRMLILLRNAWQESILKIPYAGREPSEIGKDLVEVLGMEPVSSSYSWRWARGPRFFELFWHLPGQQVNPADIDDAVQTLDARLKTILTGLNLSHTQWTRLTGTMFARVATDWEGPIVDWVEPSETATLSFNYVSAMVNPSVTLEEIHDESSTVIPTGKPKPLLYHLLRQATLLAYANQALRSKNRPNQPRFGPPWFDPELVDMELMPGDDIQGDPYQTPTFWRVLQENLPGSTLSRGGALRKLSEEIPDPLGTFLNSLSLIATLPTAKLERLQAETLDLASHRLDAWITSLATDRLRQFRAKKGNSTGIYLGGYGWLENVRPRSDQNLSDGFVHAPSIDQAKTAAILHSGYLSHQAQPDGSKLEIDLSSRRVRLALGLIAGVRESQPLGALLGYRFERALFEASPALNRLITHLRALAPLSGEPRVSYDAGEPIEVVAANNVVDGMKLLDRYKDTSSLFSALNDRLPLSGKLSADEKEQVKKVWEDLNNITDAISDLGLAEGVFQAVRGNYLRGGAMLDALSRGEAPGQVEVTETFQSKVDFFQRLVILFNSTLSTNQTSWNRNRARAMAEPVLNAWAEQLLGDPKRVRCQVNYFNPDSVHVDYTGELRLDALKLCPLDLIYALPVTDKAQQTEIELIIARAALKAKPPAIQEGASVRLVFAKDASYTDEDLTFPQLFEIVRVIRELLANTANRAINDLDLVRAGKGGEPTINASELQKRYSNVEAAWNSSKKALVDLYIYGPVSSEKVAILTQAPYKIPAERLSGKVNLLDLAASPDLPNRVNLVDVCAVLDTPALSQLEDVRSALQAFGAFAVQGAVPRSIGQDTVEARRVEARRDLTDQAQKIYKIVNDIDAVQLKAISGTGWKEWLARLAVLFGEAFRVLPIFSLTAQHDLFPGLARRIQAGDTSSGQVTSWLQKVSQFRGGVKRLATALLFTEVTGGEDEMAYLVAQFPYGAGDHWNEPIGPADKGATSLVIRARNDLNLSAPLAGLMIDEWQESVPSQIQKTALAFHYDSPGSVAPQAILLAVSPDSSRRWTQETLWAILNETFDLARLRTIDYDALSELGHFLPAVFLANNVGGDQHGDTVSANLFT